ncbi:MAG TPA: hypothetical protein VN809_13700, partial [Telmatospirillum sp.]|nr:hypothetical protein [Telmatospirillum sp.]
MSLFTDDPSYLAVRKAFDAPWPGPRGPRVHLRDGDLTATIFPADGCRLTSLTAFGYELLRPWNPARRAFQYGSFPMVPWVGRLQDGLLRFEGSEFRLPVNKPPHALHGMACFGPWAIVETSPTMAEFQLQLDDPWPWKGLVTQRYALKDNALSSTVSIASSGETFPAAAGWHPWFRKWVGNAGETTPVPTGSEDEALNIAFSADWQEEPGPDELPTGRRLAPRPGPWDDCFGFEGFMSASLLWPGKLRLEMTASASSMV